MANVQKITDAIAPSPTEEYEDIDNSFDDILYARHAEIKTFEDLEAQRGTSIPALYNQLFKFVQNPSTVSVETYKRMTDTDETIGAGVDFLTSCLAARLGRYTHDSKEITEFVNKILGDIEGGWTNLVKDLLSATWAGFAVGETVWHNTEDGFVPRRVITLPPTTVLFETERTGELTPDGILQYQRNYNPFLAGTGFGGIGIMGLGTGFAGVGSGRPDPYAKFGDFPFPMRTANSFNYLSIRIPTQKCIHYPFNAQGQFGNPYGRSILRRAYKYYVMKDAILQMMMIALDRKGTALTVVFADPNAMVEDGTKDNGTGPQQFRNDPTKGMSAAQAAKVAFNNVHNDSTIILPGKKGEIYETEFMPSASNVQDFIAAKDMCDRSMTRAMLLPSLIFGSGDGGGSWALGQEHSKTFDKICDSINAGLEHVLLQQFIKPIIAFNFPKSAWAKEGLGGFSKRSLSQEEVQKEAEMYEKGVNMGIIDANDLNDLNKMRDTIGFEPRDTIIEKADPFGMGGMVDGDEGAGAGGDPKGAGKPDTEESSQTSSEDKTEDEESSGKKKTALKSERKSLLETLKSWLGV